MASRGCASATTPHETLASPELHVDGNELVITQSPESQAAIEDFIELLDKRFDANGVAMGSAGESNARLATKLEQTRISVDFDGLPQAGACARLEHMIGVPVSFDHPPPASPDSFDFHVDPAAVYLHLDDVSAASAVAILRGSPGPRRCSSTAR